MSEEKEVIENKVYSVVEVPTGSALAFQTPEGKVMGTEELLVDIANKVNEVKKALA